MFVFLGLYMLYCQSERHLISFFTALEVFNQRFLYTKYKWDNSLEGKYYC